MRPPAVTDPMFSSSTDVELLVRYHEMSRQATRLGVDYRSRSSFDGRDELLRECEALHARLEKHRPGRAVNPAARRPQKESKTMTNVDTDNAADETKKKRGRKAPAKGGKAAKAAKPAKGGKAAKADGAIGRTKYSEDAKITVKVKENPRRENTGAHERFALLMKCDGQTVGTFLKKGGVSATLNRAVEEGHASVK